MLRGLGHLAANNHVVLYLPHVDCAEAEAPAYFLSRLSMIDV